VRPLGPEGGVAAVAGVDPGRVGQPVEDLGDNPEYSELNRAESFCVFPTPPGNRP
jgi:hypothetical protein